MVLPVDVVVSVNEFLLQSTVYTTRIPSHHPYNTCPAPLNTSLGTNVIAPGSFLPARIRHHHYEQSSQKIEGGTPYTPGILVAICQACSIISYILASNAAPAVVEFEWRRQSWRCGSMGFCTNRRA